MRDAAFFRIGFTHPLRHSLFLEFRRVTLFFTVVRLLSVCFGVVHAVLLFASASRSKISFDLTRLLITRDAIYERPLRNNVTNKSGVTGGLNRRVTVWDYLL